MTDPAFQGYCTSCGKSCYGQSECDNCSCDPEPKIIKCDMCEVKKELWIYDQGKGSIDLCDDCFISLKDKFDLI